MAENTPRRPVELLLPAGSPEAFYAALEGGADAIYLGLDRFNARGRAKNFSRKQFLAAIALAHSRGARVYLTLNTLIKNEELPALIELLSFVAATEVDAVIVQDWGVYYSIKKYFPNLKIHASTQMAVHNSAGTAMAARLGFECVVMARELTLPEIAAAARASENMRDKSAPPVRIEIFAHGALCYSVSGHCLFSSWVGGMSANRGLCRQACRRNYSLCSGDDAESAPFPLFNLRDLELVDHLGALEKAGVGVLKIEGRMKPAEYVSRVAKAYRLALDGGQPAAAKEILENDFTREKTSYFAGGNIKNALTNRSFTGRVLGRVSKITAQGFTLRLECALAKTARLRIQSSSGEDSPAFGIDALRCGGALTDRAEAGQEAEVIMRAGAREDALREGAAPLPPRGGGASLPPLAQAGDLVLLVGTKDMRFPSNLPIADVAFPKRMSGVAQDKILYEISRDARNACDTRDAHDTHSIGDARRATSDIYDGRDACDPSDAHDTHDTRGAHDTRNACDTRRDVCDGRDAAGGRYAMRPGDFDHTPADELIMRIDNLAWLAKVQPEKLDALILNFTLHDWEEFDAARPSVLRNKDRFVVQLPLFISEKEIGLWRRVVLRLYKTGFMAFMASQVWQLPLFDGLDNIDLWAAETVYCLNDAAGIFLSSLGFKRRVLPLENDLFNLSAARDRTGIIPLYARPKLFISRVPPGLRTGDICRDRTGEYRADIQGGILELTPIIPMGWFQYRFDLEDMGYSRFLIDLSAEKPSQNTFRRMLKHYEEGISVQPSSAFNYKDGLS
jgi:putative protease